ncbi:MAG: hypothetical protein HXY41_08235 [Chloroflexi bacterium]|nr:hypothetical protein [Chloroflexota bacterium]
MTTSLDQFPQRDGLYRILPEGVAVHNRYQDQIVMLDALSSEIWLRADGKTSLREIAGDLAGWLKKPVAVMNRLVAMLAVVLNSEGLLYQQDQSAELPYHLAFPQEDQDINQMYESLAAAGWLDE